MRWAIRSNDFSGIDYWEYPSEALREALLNAIIHRDYSITGGRIRVFMFDDRVEFYSPGDLLPGVTVERMQRLESQSKLRNPVIVEAFRDLGGFIEKMGTGIQRMARAMEEHGLPIPPVRGVGRRVSGDTGGAGGEIYADNYAGPGLDTGVE
jgi:ATP-dependent DNA helicase RecG